MPYNYIEDKSEDNWLDKLLAPTMNLAGNAPLSKSSTPAKPMNPIVKEALMKKITPQRAPAAELPAVEPEMQGESAPAYDAQADFESQKVSPLAVLASGLGDAFAGRAPSREWADKLDKTTYEQTVSKSMKDAENSEKIRQYDEDRLFKNKELAKKIRQFGIEQALKRDELGLKNKELTPKTASDKKTANALNSADKKRINDAQGAYEGIKDMAAALNNGDFTFSPIGDNNFTNARSRFIESFGRLQSGGAISADEVENFKNLVPKSTDSREMQQLKLNKLEEQVSRVMSQLGQEMSRPATAADSNKKYSWED